MPSPNESITTTSTADEPTRATPEHIKRDPRWKALWRFLLSDPKDAATTADDRAA